MLFLEKSNTLIAKFDKFMCSSINVFMPTLAKITGSEGEVIKMMCYMPII